MKYKCPKNIYLYNKNKYKCKNTKKNISFIVIFDISQHLIIYQYFPKM